jgi:sterol desaturase/sphingolipid hydroxylase (fatty acid hydroxylase superfamily)
MTALNILVLGALPVSGLAAAELAQANGWGLFNAIEVPFAILLVVGFALRSLVSYGIHVAMHKVPVLWRMHRVHHTDTALDVSTTVRFHPLEFAVSVPIVVAAIVASGISPLVIMLYELFDAVLAVFSHANIRLPRGFERVLQMLIVTPDMHRVHHSSARRETDSNYGATLSVWDHVFGTYTRKTDGDLAAMQLGLKECRDERAASFLWLLASPFMRLSRADGAKQAPASKPTSSPAE